ncbi:hypothetical protein SAMN05421678_104187 [Actinopolymorpha cephalotaxi]|uniref:Uncharacterized protein n=1 Tax=Actinopolymorpha cephalotaxi TaxID=504797 RepID=A0A1I2PTC1_9ACTN|nr:hypothetical protein [Actinopolymorpha cephalotaxi]NYH83561.1 hypothetical protein [Actinopolymorpha cephalotaxi]SFG16856.1 hypothetical protein SAMN05421678_104187 [Actinopolymorpha cephalotaxi]
MSHPGSGPLRIIRGALLAVCCTALAVLGHVGGGGEAPPVTALVAGTLVVGAAFAVLADRRRAFGQILAAALVAQAIFHAAFSLACAHGFDVTTGSAITPGPVAGAPAEVFPGPVMVLAHLGAAALLAALAAAGETLVWVVFHLLGLVRLPALTLPSPAGVNLTPARHHHDDLPGARELRVCRAHRRRGPPAVMPAPA